MAVDETSFISSNLDSGSFDDETGEMKIVFLSGMEYSYQGITPDLWQSLKTAISPGRFMLDNVKGKFPYEQV